MNLYMYNYPEDYKKASSQFTTEDFYFVVIHTTEGLLRDMTEEIASSMQRNDVTGWYASKDIDNQYQIKCGEVLGRISGWQRTLNVGKYMELKVIYRQQHRNPIENKTEYKQNHYHDYSLIMTNTNLDDDYAVKITIKIYTYTQARRQQPTTHEPIFPIPSTALLTSTRAHLSESESDEG
eukprot:3778310-Amphidinium_carterae.3